MPDFLSFSEGSRPDDFIFDVENKPWLSERHKRFGKVEKYDVRKRARKREEVEARKLDDQLGATVASIKEKGMHDESTFYFVIEADSSGQRIYAALGQLRATVHAYLDTEHFVLLVSMAAGDLERHTTRKLPLGAKEPILRIRELKLSEQVSGEIDASSQSEHVVLHLMPSLDTVRQKDYRTRLTAHLERIDCPILWQPSSLEGMIVAEMPRTKVYETLRESNLIFKAHLMPKGSISRVRSRRQGGLASRPTLSSVDQSAAQPTTPLVCVVDTGVTLIPQLNGLVEEREKLDIFPDCDDGHSAEGHGTPIACLVCFGEGSGSSRAKILSFKVYSDENREWALRGVEEALFRYGKTARIFVSSINFEGNALPAYARIDEMLQELNVCYVSSAGNIPGLEVIPIALQYPTYIQSYNVQHLAQNVHVIGVGAITNHHNGNTIAPSGALSPFTTCGKTLPTLFDVKKPDVVEHGGNMTYDGGSNAVGVMSFDKNGASTNNLAGTSFSSPLVAGRLAEIVSKYGHRIKNAETLKAILFMSCRRLNYECSGMGVPQPFLGSKPHQATFVTEGEVPLSDLTIKKIERRHEHRVSVLVPSGVKKIRMCLVHSDNFPSSLEPSLDTFMHVRVTKTGHRKGSIQPDEGTEAQNAWTYVKLLTWTFAKKDMEGEWRFDLLPESVRPIDPERRKNVRVRYGCVIMLENLNPGLISLTKQVRREMSKRVRG